MLNFPICSSPTLLCHVYCPEKRRPQSAESLAEARFSLASEPHPATAVTILNRRMCDLNLNRFVTFVMVVLEVPDDDPKLVENQQFAASNTWDHRVDTIIEIMQKHFKRDAR